MSKRFLDSVAAIAILCWAGEVPSAAAQEQPAASDEGIADIIVTAQKREQSLNDVPVSITSADTEQLVNAGVRDIADLPKLVPGLTFTPSINATPILTLRGVGFNEYTLGASPTVSVYTDQVPVPFLPMARGNTYDLERVEVLKGPQGILFGQNSTGGAINYVAAKPGDRFEAGAEASYGRFDETTLAGFVSAPLNDTISTRLSLRTLQMSDWQYSAQRPSDTQGSQNLIEGRAQFRWRPSNDVDVTLAFSGWRDRSDTPGVQLIGFRPNTTATAAQRARVAIITAQPLTPANARAAEWGTYFRRDRDDAYGQVSLRADFDLSPTTSFTSISSYDRYRESYGFDRDGTTLKILDIIRAAGTIEDFTQEWRLAGNTSALTWVAGANYFHAQAGSINRYRAGDASNTIVLGNPFDEYNQTFDLNVEEFAFFGNAEVKVLPIVTMVGGVRYTDSTRQYNGCTRGDAGLSRGLTILSTVLSRSPTAAIVPGQCVTLLSNFKPGEFRDRLAQDNLSWRGGVNLQPNGDTLIYANVTRGYKSGSYPVLAASTFQQLLPVTQESITAYEAGAKLTLANRRVQLNGAVFLYDYRDKQVRGNVIDPTFGVLERLINVPRSRIRGAELQLLVVPVRGLTLNASGTYLDTDILEFTGLNEARQTQNFRGQPIPFTPKWQGSADVEYRLPAGDALEIFAGSNVTHNSATNSSIATPAYARLRPFTILDLRAGVSAADGSWTISAYGRNITDQYYWTNAFATQDVIVRYAARPVTYGLRGSFRFR